MGIAFTVCIISEIRFPFITARNWFKDDADLKFSKAEQSSERRWTRGLVCGSQSPLTSKVLDSICSQGKSEEICDSLIVKDITVYDNALMLRSDLSGRKAQM